MHRVRAHDEARAALGALPAEALTSYVEVLDVLELDPWRGPPFRKDNPEGNIRTLAFGPRSEGLATYLILEREQRVDVLEVQWAG